MCKVPPILEVNCCHPKSFCARFAHNVFIPLAFYVLFCHIYFFFSRRSRHTRWPRDWSSDVCSSDLPRRGKMRGGAYVPIAPLFSRGRPRPTREDTAKGLDYFIRGSAKRRFAFVSRARS